MSEGEDRWGVAAGVVRDVDPWAAPPEIRTVGGETLFVAAAHREELGRWCVEHGIPVRTRPDVWADLLEPFLDTGFTPEQDAAGRERLSRVGLDGAAVDGIRAEVGPLMRAYNAVHQDWCHLGLADLLAAAEADWIPSGPKEGPARDRAGFRAWAMRIADLPER